MSRLRTATENDVLLIVDSIQRLRGVREQLKAAGARQAARYVAAAIKSVEGAERHVQGVLLRQASKAAKGGK